VPKLHTTSDSRGRCCEGCKLTNVLIASPSARWLVNVGRLGGSRSGPCLGDSFNYNDMYTAASTPSPVPGLYNRTLGERRK
jgi:hypothetical protein